MVDEGEVHPVNSEHFTYVFMWNPRKIVKNSKICSMRILKLQRNWIKPIAPLNSQYYYAAIVETPLHTFKQKMSYPDTIWAYGIQPTYGFVLIH